MNESPYAKFQESEVWKIVEKAIEDLVANQDIKEMTPRSYIIGYIVKCMIESELLKHDT